MANDDVVVLGAATLRERIRTNKAGASKSKFTIEVSGESIGIGLDPKSYGAPVAAAIAELYKERIRSITATASAATVRAREAAKAAFARGEAWAMKRYGGGRIGSLEPGQSDRLFNDSGRFAQSIAVGSQPGDANFTINVAANRLSTTTISAAALQTIWQKLVSLVPEFADPKKLMDSIPVRKSIDEALKANVIVGGEKTEELRRKVKTAGIALLKRAGSALVSLAS